MADEQITSNTANIPFVNLAEQGSDPTTPATGRAALYVKGGALYVRLDDGTVIPVGGSVALAEGQLAVGDGSGVLSALSLGTEGQLVTADASGHATWDDAPEGGGGGNAGLVMVPSFAVQSSTGSAPYTSTQASTLVYYILTRATYANGDSLTYNVDLPAGTYTVQTMYMNNSSGGLVDITLGGVTVGTIDAYSGTTNYSQLVTHTGIVLATGGIKALVQTVNGKNPSSASYQWRPSLTTIWRTA